MCVDANQNFKPPLINYYILHYSFRNHQGRRKRQIKRVHVRQPAASPFCKSKGKIISGRRTTRTRIMMKRRTMTTMTRKCTRMFRNTYQRVRKTRRRKSMIMKKAMSTAATTTTMMIASRMVRTMTWSPWARLPQVRRHLKSPGGALE